MDMPVYNLPVIFRQYRKLTDEVALHYYGCRPTGADFEGLVDTLRHALPPGTPRDPLRESVRHLAGVELGRPQVEELCWRLAGNAGALKRGQVVPPWSKQANPEWAPAQVLHVQRGWSSYRLRGGPQVVAGKTVEKVSRPGGQVTMRLLAGPAAGWKLTRFWSSDYVHVIKRELGFDRFDRGPYRRTPLKVPDMGFRDVRELARLRFCVLLAPCLGTEGPLFTEVKGTHTMRSFNRGLLRRRLRLGHECPLGYPEEEVPCYTCELGYDRCPAGCHPRTFTRGDCPRCNRHDVWFDRPSNPDVCVDCAAKPESPDDH
jgi:hypothetical protein